MAKQLKWMLRDVDGKLTKEAVERELEKASYYAHYGALRREMKVTPSYSPRYHGPTNEVGRPAEDTALWNVEKDKEHKEQLDWVMSAVNLLQVEQREIIMRRYFADGGVNYDYQVYNDLGWSER